MPDGITPTRRAFVVYRVVHIETGKTYVGCTTKPRARWRDHHYQALNAPRLPFHRSLRKYGTDAFRFEIIEECADHETMLAREQHWIRCLNTMTPHGYNITAGGEGANGVVQSREAVAKRADAIRGRRWSDESRARMSEVAKNRSAEHLAKIAASLTGNQVSEETKDRIRAARAKQVMSAETCAKISAAHRGRVHTDQSRANMSAAQRGRVVTEAHRAKIRDTLQQLTNADAALIKFDALGLTGVAYAARFGISPQSVCGIQKGRSYRHVTEADLPPEYQKS